MSIFMGGVSWQTTFGTWQCDFECFGGGGEHWTWVSCRGEGRVHGPGSLGPILDPLLMLIVMPTIYESFWHKTIAFLSYCYTNTIMQNLFLTWFVWVGLQGLTVAAVHQYQSLLVCELSIVLLVNPFSLLFSSSLQGVALGFHYWVWRILPKSNT